MSHHAPAPVVPARAAPESRLVLALQALVFWLVRLFYPRVAIEGRERVPDGAVLLLINHPNGLLDPLLVMMALGRPVNFLAKSTLFGNPLGRFLSRAFGALPVYRRQDEGKPGGPHGDARQRNEETFALCRSLLRAGGALALSPEGTSHSGSELRPIRSGAARIALGAEAEADWSLGLRVLPIGLWYQDRDRFRTAVLLVVGQPFALAEYRDQYQERPQAAVRAVTARIEAGLDQVVLQAETADLLRALPIIAAWTAPEGATPTLSQHHQWMTRLLITYHQLRQSDPARLEAFAERARRYARALQMLGIADPWALELSGARRARPLRTIALMIVTAPVAVLGLIMSFVPYRLAGPLAVWGVGPHDTQVSLIKILGGSVLLLLAWIAEALVIGRLFGPWWGWLLLLVALPAGRVALWWGERWNDLVELAATHWLRTQERALVARLARTRQMLADEVRQAVAEVEGVARDAGPAPAAVAAQTAGPSREADDLPQEAVRPPETDQAQSADPRQEEAAEP